MTKIRDLKKKQKALYSSIISVFCPILNDTIFFNSDGFNHLLYQSNRKPRNIGEQFMKLRCLPHAPEVITKCAVITDTRKITRKVKGVYKSGVRYELVHEVEKDIKIRVVVEKIGTGKHKFLSIMPHTNKSKITMTNKKHP
jgi:hypothetical protein